MKLSKQEEIVYNQLEDLDGMIIRGHKATDGAAVYRVLDYRLNPICNLKKLQVDSLVKKGLLTINGQIKINDTKGSL